MDLKDPNKMWDKLKHIYTKVDQEIIYSILLELLHHPKITQLKEYEKLVMLIFVEVKYLYKHLWITLTSERDFWDTIVIVYTPNSVEESFDTTTASLLETSDKIINLIQSILQSKKVKNINKQAIRLSAGNFFIAFRAEKPKKMASGGNKCYNCHKFGHFKRDSFLSNRRLNEIIYQS